LKQLGVKGELTVQSIAAPHPLVSLPTLPLQNFQVVVSPKDRKNDSTSPTR
jgi:hypothetical protein